MTLVTIKVFCSGVDHPNASKSRAVKDCSEFVLLDQETTSQKFKYLCRNCAAVASPPPNTFTGKQFDRGLTRSGRGVHRGQVNTKAPSLNDPEDFGNGLK
jgi:hypothetical protein